jgi:hypothetical protein
LNKRPFKFKGTVTITTGCPPTVPLALGGLGNGNVSEYVQERLAICEKTLSPFTPPLNTIIMAQDYTSYTFKLTDRAGTNIYSPYGDGPPSSGWQTLLDTQGHNTFAPNASLQISFQGTAITVNGFVNSSQGLPPAYMLSLDGQSLAQETLDEGRTSQEILLSKTGLQAGYHTLLMSNMDGGNLTVKGVQLSVATGNTRWVVLFLGLGNTDLSVLRTTWRDTAITATISSNALWNPNPFFTFGGNWFPASTSH